MEELNRSITDPMLLEPGPTWIVISSTGKRTFREGKKAHDLEGRLGAKWVRTHYIDTSHGVTRPVVFSKVYWEKRMMAGYHGWCNFVCHEAVEPGQDIVLVDLVDRVNRGKIIEGWVHTICATRGVLDS